MLVLEDNGGDDVTLLADGGDTQSFAFATALASGAGYDVTVATQPNDMVCTVDGGSGTISGANVTDVAVGCACAAGNTLCPSGCTNLSADPANCGTCSVVCPSGVCGTTLSAVLDVPPGDWTINGDSFIDAGQLTVTADEAGQAGTLIYNDPIAADTFTVTFDFNITVTAGKPADGIGFMLETNDAGIVGTPTAGGALGMTGLDGFGVEFDTYDNGDCSDDSANHVGVDDLTACGSSTPTSLAATGNLFDGGAAPLSLSDGAWHTAEIDVVAGAVTVKVDGNALLTDIALTGFSGTTPYYFGFSGATGASHSQQLIRNVQITFPSGTCQ